MKLCFKIEKTASQTQETKLCFVTRNQKMNSSVVSGTVHLLHVCRNQGKSYPTLRACWKTFSTVRTLFIRNLSLQAKWLTSITTRKFCDMWVCKSIENLLNNGKTRTGWLTVTIHFYRRLSVEQLSDANARLWSPSLLIRLTWPLAMRHHFQDGLEIKNSHWPFYRWFPKVTWHWKVHVSFFAIYIHSNKIYNVAALIVYWCTGVSSTCFRLLRSETCRADTTLSDTSRWLYQRNVSDSAVHTTYHSLHIQHLKRSSWGWTVTVQNM